jgi:hypothetical protein
VIAQDADLRVVAIHPGIDSPTLIWRGLLGRPKFFSRFWRVESPLNWLVRFAAKISRHSTAKTNVQKLQFCGQFVFSCAKD